MAVAVDREVCSFLVSFKVSFGFFSGWEVICADPAYIPRVKLSFISLLNPVILSLW